ncbi:MAG: peptide chain release factor N(5)-glutamine methyltransferase [Lachnoclostridium sp.]|jgi:release factor glutamine methyltransferase|nr:peptide chain release factor N(5)-glutamine methyltransferase [Lachnoclostridium sp.]
MTKREALIWGRKVLEENDVPHSDFDAKTLLEYVLHVDYGRILMDESTDLSEDERDKYQAFIERRRRRIPLQHIMNYTEFMGLLFSVSKDVLIPRQDTECVVEWILPIAKNKRILDLCTGSGCIGISIAVLGESAEVDCSDISEEALHLAKENAENNQVKVRVIKSDLFRDITGKYDIIVSNPPYIRTDDINGLMPEVRDHEPKMALDGGEDGCFFYRQIISEASSFLNPEGLLVFEIGCEQAEYVSEYMKKSGYSNIRVGKDLSGNDRIVGGVWK